MKVFKEFDIRTFDAWSGGKDTKEVIINEGKAEEFNNLMEDIFPDGASETQVNDFLWFEDDHIFEMLGIEID